MPIHNNLYKKQIIRSSKALDSYSNWFSISDLTINRVNPSPVIATNFHNITLEKFDRITSSLPARRESIFINASSQSWPQMITRKKIINLALNTWQDQIEHLNTRHYLNSKNSSPMEIKNNSLISFIDPVGLSKVRSLFLSDDQKWKNQLSNTLSKCTDFIESQRKILKTNEPNSEPEF